MKKTSIETDFSDMLKKNRNLFTEQELNRIKEIKSRGKTKQERRYNQKMKKKALI